MSRYIPLQKEHFNSILADIRRDQAQFRAALLAREQQAAEMRARNLLDQQLAARRQPLEYSI